MAFTWQNGRQLASVSQNGTTVATYTYDADGLRTSKTVGETVTEYYWMNGMLYGQKTGEEYIFFLYDENGNVYGFVVKNSNSQSYYYYEFNLQGDIIGIINSSGTRAVEYAYGVWGDILSITGTLADTIGQKNPLRCKGYYYDVETGFYYLQSRYYDAEICRFINVDSLNTLFATLFGLTDKNLFTYCDNNPVTRIDCGGYFWESILDFISLGASAAEVYVNPTDPWAWAGLGGDIVDLIPFVTGVGEVTRAVKISKKVDNIADTVNQVDNIADITKTSKKIHGNSLKSTKTNYGYALVDKNNNIMKFGETVNPS